MRTSDASVNTVYRKTPENIEDSPNIPFMPSDCFLRIIAVHL